MKSTPPACYDHVVCVVEDTVLALTGSDSMTISSVTGIATMRVVTYHACIIVPLSLR